MADVHSKKVRSYNMSRIKNKDTKPELIVRRFLHKNGFRYRLHKKNLPGKPDIILKKYNAVIFVNGCFWHGHEGCRYFKLPKTKSEWWKQKILGTKERDRKARESLTKEGWKVITIFECELKKEARDQTLRNLIKRLKEEPYDKQNK
jgi:DNA mismatch endonuclease (patch repair protein)